MTDARLLARHLEWGATTDAARSFQCRQRRRLSLELDVGAVS
jgi:hypothetical protein